MKGLQLCKHIGQWMSFGVESKNKKNIVDTISAVYILEVYINKNDNKNEKV